MKRVFLFAVLAAVLLAPLFWLPAPGGDGEAEPGRAVLEQVNVVSKHEGRVLWSLYTDEAHIGGLSSEATMKRVEVELPGEDMKVQAAGGIYNMEEGSLLLTGGVHAVTRYFEITTETASVDSRSGTIESTGRVVMEGARFRVVGNRFRALGEKVWLEHGVTAEFF
jgi:hypothetical protein